MKEARIKLIQDCVTLIRHSNLDDVHVAAKIHDLIETHDDTERLQRPPMHFVQVEDEEPKALKEPDK